jgi:pimeloyl-ACP methyl ester carboxylesterase
MKTINASPLLLILAFALSGCFLLPPTQDPVPTREVRAASGAHDRLVVVLPGRGDDLDSLEKFGIAQAVQEAMPDADVLLVEATLSYYFDGKLVQRLHEQVIEPARARGYREIWLSGASMGGLGTLMYEHDHPGAVDGLVLMAPFMGSSSIQKEIRAAGGLASWDPGPAPVALSHENLMRGQWRVVKSWLANPTRAQNVWLICGEDDRLLPASELIATALPPQHTLTRPGGHKWIVWAPAAREALSAAQLKQAAIASGK